MGIRAGMAVSFLLLFCARDSRAAQTCGIVTKTLENACMMRIMCPEGRHIEGPVSCQAASTCSLELPQFPVRNDLAKVIGMDVVGVENAVTGNRIECSMNCCSDGSQVPLPPATQTGLATDTAVTSETATATATATSAPTNTAVVTFTSTATSQGTFTYTDTSRITAVATSSSTFTQTSTTRTGTSQSTSTADDSDSEQKRFLENQANLLDGAGKQALTIGAVNCLDGANELLEDESAGQEKIADCLRKMQAGKGMKENGDATAKRAGKAGLNGGLIDEEQLSSERARAIFEKFGKNYKISGEELVRRMLESGANFDELKEALKTKFSEDKVAQLMASAENVKFEIDLKRKSGAARKSSKPNYREQLRAALAKVDEAPNSWPVSTPKNRTTLREPSPGPEDLTPLQDPLFAGSDQQELSIFEVVSRKYRDKWDMMIAYKKK